MLLVDALNHIIDDGIEAARADYTKPGDKLKLEGSIRGFEECRGLTPNEILTLLGTSARDMNEKHRERAPDYWFWSCRWNEISWVANVLSVILQAQGLRPISMMTCGGAMKAAEIIGVAEVSSDA